MPISKIALLGRVHEIRQGSKKLWIDSIKKDYGTLGMTIPQAFRTAQDRSNWRTAINGPAAHACSSIARA